MISVTKVKNINKGEAVFRIILGAVLIVAAFLTSGISRWILGLAGVAFLLTAFFGY